MNTKQLTVLLVAALVLALSEIFPPWLYVNRWTSGLHYAGYHYVHSPPATSDVYKMRKIFKVADNEPDSYFTVQKDRFLIYDQYAMLMFLTFGLLLALATRRTTLRIVFRVIFFALGLCFSAGMVFYLVTVNW